MFDTTSALTQLPRVGCESPGYPSCAANSSWTGSTVPTLFAPNASSTYQLLATNATINYTDVLSTTNDIGQDAVAAVTSTQATLVRAAPYSCRSKTCASACMHASITPR